MNRRDILKAIALAPAVGLLAKAEAIAAATAPEPINFLPMQPDFNGLEDFQQQFLRQIVDSLGLTYDQLTADYERSYSSARASFAKGRCALPPYPADRLERTPSGVNSDRKSDLAGASLRASQSMVNARWSA